jgi:hypothetical protein
MSITPNKLQRRSLICAAEYPSVTTKKSSDSTSPARANQTTTLKVAVDTENVPKTTSLGHKSNIPLVFAEIKGQISYSCFPKNKCSASVGKSEIQNASLWNFPDLNEKPILEPNDFLKVLENKYMHNITPIDVLSNEAAIDKLKNAIENASVPIPNSIKELKLECWENILCLHAFIKENSFYSSRLKDVLHILESLIKNAPLQLKDAFNSKNLMEAAQNRKLTDVAEFFQTKIVGGDYYSFTAEQKNLLMAHCIQSASIENKSEWSYSEEEDAYDEVHPFVKKFLENNKKLTANDLVGIAKIDVKNRKESQNVFAKQWLTEQTKPLCGNAIPSCGRRIDEFMKNFLEICDGLSVLAEGNNPCFQNSSDYINDDKSLNMKQLQGDMCCLLLDKNFSSDPNLQMRFIQLDRLRRDENGIWTALSPIDAEKRKFVLQTIIDTGIRQKEVNCCFAIVPLIQLQSDNPARMARLLISALVNGKIHFKCGNMIYEMPCKANVESVQETHQALINAFANISIYTDGVKGMFDFRNITSHVNNLKKVIKTLNARAQQILQNQIPTFKIMFDPSFAFTAGDNQKHIGAFRYNQKMGADENFQPVTLATLSNLENEINASIKDLFSKNLITNDQQMEILQKFEIMKNQFIEHPFAEGGTPEKVWQGLGKESIRDPKNPQNAVVKIWDITKCNNAEMAIVNIYKEMQAYRNQHGALPLRIPACSQAHAFTFAPFLSPEMEKALNMGLGVESFIENEIKKNPGKPYFFIDSNYGEPDSPNCYGVLYDERKGFCMVKQIDGNMEIIDFSEIKICIGEFRILEVD